MRCEEACYGGTDVMERPCAVARGKDINNEVYAVEQKHMVNSGVRGTKEMNLRTEVYCKSIVTIIIPYHIQVPSTGKLYYWYSRRLRRFGLVAAAHSGRCGHARAV